MADGNDGDTTNASHVMQSDNVHLKVLVPNVAAGAIIGRGGEAIAQIQREAGAKVKMAKQNDFYPGTTERVCLIVGTVEGVLMVHDYIVQHIREKREPLSPSAAGGNVGSALINNVTPNTIINPFVNTMSAPLSDNRQHGDRSQQVKILVPNSTAGMVIGKRGSYIREIKERSNAFIQISQKATDVSLLERCITVAGDVEQCKKAVRMIVLKIASDPQSNVHPYTSYSDVSGPVASAFPTGSPYAQRTPISTTAAATSNTPLTSMTGSYTGPIIAAPSMLPLGGTNAAIASAATHPIMAAMPSPALLFNPALGLFGSGNGPSLTLLSPTGSTSTGGNTPLTPGNPLRLVMGMPSANPAVPTILPHDLYSPVGPVSPLFSLQPQQGAASPHGLFTAALAQQQQSLCSPVELGSGNTAFYDQQQLAAAAAGMNSQHQQALASLFSMGALSYAAATSPPSHFSTFQPSPTSATILAQSQKTLSDNATVTRRDIQVPTSCVSRIMDRQNDYQHQFGTSLRLLSSPLSSGSNTGTGHDSSTNVSGTRLISISGPIAGVQQTVAHIQQWSLATQ